ncbi:MAG: CocE/NonD family hydrolase [Clostridia bacterium]|nr:CocE/NonD family hydrolase [Clostridia bacterium]
MIKINTSMLEMSDGARLYTRVILPGEGVFPTVFMRSPYTVRSEITPQTYRDYENNPFIRHGYAVVFQHCRGRNGSEGECIPYSGLERTDGLETISWIRTLPHYNGELYLSGGSYTSSVLLMLLNDDIPDLKALCVSVQTESMYHRNYFNGLCRTWCGFSWWLSMISQQHGVIASESEIFRRPYSQMIERATGRDMPEFTNQLIHDRYDGFWKNDPRIGAIEKLKVPVLFTGGWFDYYCYGMCSMWDRLPPDTRKKSCFIMTPFGHDLRERDPSDYHFPNAALSHDREALWFDHIRNGLKFPCGETGKFNYYLIGGNKWLTAESPYQNDPNHVFYFSRKEKLLRSKPEYGDISFTYNPDNPRHHDRHDYMFRREDTGDDVITFLSEPFKQDTSFFGPVRFCLSVTSDCSDTAFFCRLYLEENGKSYNISDAASTLLHSNPEWKRKTKCRLDILSQPTAFIVKKGERIRVDISSYSDCFVPHANTSVHFALAKKTRVARNTVYLGESYILLPRS